MNNNDGYYDLNGLLSKDTSWVAQMAEETVTGLEQLSPLGRSVTMYGSARILPEDPLYRQTEEIAAGLARRGFAVLTGGGPGVMEAANKGARQAGGVSVGVNIWLPDEQSPNTYASLSLTFRYFFVRKLMLWKHASAAIFLPGGYGTLDELFEILTLIQTRRLKPFPVVLFDSRHWSGLTDWIRDRLVAGGFVSSEEEAIYTTADSVDEVLAYIEHHLGAPGQPGEVFPLGKRAAGS